MYQEIPPPRVHNIPISINAGRPDIIATLKDPSAPPAIGQTRLDMEKAVNDNMRATIDEMAATIRTRDARIAELEAQMQAMDSVIQ